MQLPYKKVAFLIVVAATGALLLNSCAPYQAHKGTAYFKQRGKASWYGPGFAGRKTANGERFNPSQLTAAHRKLPFNTTVRVTNLDNDKSVVVRINDRGPYAGRRVIDLSKAAAKKIGLIKSGVAMVEIESVSPGKGRQPTKKIEKDVKETGGVVLASRRRVRKNGVEYLISIETTGEKPALPEVGDVEAVEAPAKKHGKASSGSTSIEDSFVLTTSTSTKKPPSTTKPAEPAPSGKTYSVDEEDF